MILQNLRKVSFNALLIVKKRIGTQYIHKLMTSNTLLDRHGCSQIMVQLTRFGILIGVTPSYVRVVIPTDFFLLK